MLSNNSRIYNFLGYPPLTTPPLPLNKSKLHPAAAPSGAAATPSLIAFHPLMGHHQLANYILEVNQKHLCGILTVSRDHSNYEYFTAKEHLTTR